MDTTLRPAHAPQTSSQSSTFSSSSTTTLGSSSSLMGTLEQPPHPFSLPAKPVNPAFATPLQPASAYTTQSAMSQTKPLAQNFSDPACASGLSIASQGMNDPVPRSEVPLANQATADYPHQVNGLGGATTAPFLQDFTLVAEAAKRAQMSIVMRDLESVTL
ncbi:Putative Podospora anserina S mat genomic DNA chromosome 2, supercontig 2 [Penicillium brasilianum]|uniref:Putative Podospora anserina S mat genomic DNA chromosome 2, supercontig 2 n=1 Tax=Penicillium brasilianum TaxID=104259 RepID=A0A0F7TR68_PENBI|nr:Putative Podospora anserina S mat genomic DNA chromosome 2, supercontig 2 [Penicillium brasilianum]